MVGEDEMTMIPGTRWFEDGAFRVKLPERHCLFCKNNTDYWCDEVYGLYMFNCTVTNELHRPGNGNDDGKCEWFDENESPAGDIVDRD